MEQRDLRRGLENRHHVEREPNSYCPKSNLGKEQRWGRGINVSSTIVGLALINENMQGRGWTERTRMSKDHL